MKELTISYFQLYTFHSLTAVSTAPPLPFSACRAPKHNGMPIAQKWEIKHFSLQMISNVQNIPPKCSQPSFPFTSQWESHLSGKQDAFLEVQLPTSAITLANMDGKCL